MATKTTPLNDETHKILKDIQTGLKDKYSISMSIQDIVAILISDPEEGIRKVTESIKNSI